MRVLALICGVSAVAISAASPTRAESGCTAWPGELEPLPNVQDADPFSASWARLRSDELAKAAHELEATKPAEARRVWEHVGCLDPTDERVSAAQARLDQSTDAIQTAFAAEPEAFENAIAAALGLIEVAPVTPPREGIEASGKSAAAPAEVVASVGSDPEPMHADAQASEAGAPEPVLVPEVFETAIAAALGLPAVSAAPPPQGIEAPRKVAAARAEAVAPVAPDPEPVRVSAPAPRARASAPAPPKRAAAARRAPPAAPSVDVSEIDARLAELEETLFQANFREALELASKLRDELGASRARPGVGPRVARLELLAGTAELALRRVRAANESFARALSAQPGLRPDPVTTSPRVRRAFDAVRSTHGSSEG